MRRSRKGGFGPDTTAPRVFLWVLLGAFTSLLWLLLAAFHWEISLRSREIEYFGTRLFPAKAQVVPLPVIYAVCIVLTLAAAGTILRDRSNLRSRERIRGLLFQILQSLEIGVVVLDTRGRLSLANESARRILPEIPADQSGREMREVFASRGALLKILRSAVEDASYSRELEHELAVGTQSFPARISTLPLRNAQGRTSGTLLLVEDVREVVLLERQMRTAERLSALGTLAAALAHEIRNPLEAMNLNLALLERNLDPPRDDTRRLTQILEKEISRLAGTLDDFLSFARPSGSAAEDVNLGEILRQIVDLLENQARAQSVSLELAVGEAGLLVPGSADQLKQAFLNLVINSLEAMPGGGRLSIVAENGSDQPGAGGVPVAVVKIRDTGEGIPQEQLGRLFDPYYTTRPGGTGLGLTIVHRVVQEHRGRVLVESVPGRGSTFTVELPLQAREPTQHD